MLVSLVDFSVFQQHVSLYFSQRPRFNLQQIKRDLWWTQLHWNSFPRSISALPKIIPAFFHSCLIWRIYTGPIRMTDTLIRRLTPQWEWQVVSCPQKVDLFVSLGFQFVNNLIKELVMPELWMWLAAFHRMHTAKLCPYLSSYIAVGKIK